MNADAVLASAGSLRVGGRDLPLISGEVHYWRTDPARWPDVLDRAAELGIRIVATYVPWRRHEPEEGQVRWGADDPSLDLRRFIQLCDDRGLAVHLKPGPWICAEETAGGYPDWLLARTADLALGAGGLPCGGYNTPFVHPVPSMHAPRYLEAARRWLHAVWDHVGDLTHPHGPIVAVQLDNEPSLCFQDAVGFADYHPRAVEAFRSWLYDRYDGDTAAWHRAWGQAAGPDFDKAEPPRPAMASGEGTDLFGEVTNLTPPSGQADRDWLSFIEDALIDHLMALRDIHRSAGAGHLLTTVNIIPNLIHEAPLRHRRVRERLGPAVSVGVDHYYEPPLSWDLVGVLARTAASARAAGEPLVWAPEMMAGIWRSPGEQVAYPDPTPDEEAAWWGAAMAVGYQGFNFYMLTDRVNWELAPVSADGTSTAFAAPLAQLIRTINACPDMLKARPVTSVTVATHRPDMLDAHTTEGTMRQPVVPWADPARRTAYEAWERLVTRLVRDSVGYELWNTDDPAPPQGTVVLVAQPTSITAEQLETIRGRGCVVVMVPPEGDPLKLAQVEPPVRIVAHDPDTQVLAALHALRDGSAAHETADGTHFLHVVQWGATASSTPRALQIRPPAAQPGAWKDVLTGSVLAPYHPHDRSEESWWELPFFVGHRIYRWESHA